MTEAGSPGQRQALPGRRDPNRKDMRPDRPHKQRQRRERSRLCFIIQDLKFGARRSGILLCQTPVFVI